MKWPLWAARVASLERRYLGVYFFEPTILISKNEKNLSVYGSDVNTNYK